MKSCFKKNLVFLALIFILCFVLVNSGCNNNSVNLDNMISRTYKVTYTLGEGVEGTPPVDENEYSGGQIISLASAPVREGFVFDGWQCIYGLYNAGDNFQMRYNDVTFTATWWKGNRYWVSSNYNSVSSPSFSNYSTEVSAGTTVEITCSTEDAEIFYTTDGSVPSRESIKYEDPIEINSILVLKAVAYKTGYYRSNVNTHKYYIAGTRTYAPDFDVPEGDVPTGTPVTITCSTPGAEIYYTTNGVEPTAASTKYTAPITINSSMTLKAVAITDDINDSYVVSRKYNVTVYVCPVCGTAYATGAERDACNKRPGCPLFVAVVSDNFIIDGVEIPYSNLVTVAGGTVNGTTAYAINGVPGAFGVDGRNLTIPSFQMGAYEVTQRLYKAVMTGDANATDEPSSCRSGAATYIYSDANDAEKDLRPVETLTWYDAVYFCNKLSEKTGKTPFYDITGITWGAGHISDATVVESTVTGHESGYRLPYRAEWEYVARGTNPSTESTSNWMRAFAGKNAVSLSIGSQDSELDSVCWYGYNSATGVTGASKPTSGQTGYGSHRVGLKDPVLPNLPIYDLSGNAGEWINERSATINASTPFSGEAVIERVINIGGTYISDADKCCVTDSSSYSTLSTKTSVVGFRVVCTAE